jgi:epoxyqueuosine reductase
MPAQNLLAALDCAALPAEATAPMLTSGVPLYDYRRLVLLGHGGQRLWAALQEWGMKTADPVDHHTP